ncbi:transmembrane protein [Cavenderia fasciculata]|uniref:Transmembrane protein n=1 Tax=Cavenderia fasciculata TaxID=261658 RepID=F4QBE9_CACFS|nr:uncharacterized protein DFA_10795 [Cavenderia fasciculata]EGG14921.1 transmembrane protein [Cavenderia fasciculata]|eukprot:XP_004351437.1 transmembrane protein [Cavenderia fasciculata]
MKLKIGIGLQVLVLVGCIIGFALPWYQIKRSSYEIGLSNIDEAVTYFRWKDVQCVVGGEEESKESYSDASSCPLFLTTKPIYVTNEFDDVAKILNTCLSFLVIGAALALGTALLQLILLLSPKLCRSIIWKILCIGCSMATIAILFVSFFTLFGMPKALDDDIVFCLDDAWCDKIYGSSDGYSWMPGGGWWATLAACFTALCAGLFTLVSSR